MKTYESSAKTIEEAISAGLDHLGVSIGEVTIDILEEGSKGLFGLFGSRLAKVRLTMKDQEEEESLWNALSRESDKSARDSEKPAKEAKTREENVKKEQSRREAPKKDETVKSVTGAEEPKKVAAAEKKPVERKPAPKAAPKENQLQNWESRPADVKPAAPQEPVVPAPQADPASPEGRAQQFLQTMTTLMGVGVSVAVSRDEEGNVLVNMQGDTLGILIGRRGETLDALQYLTSLMVNKGSEQYIRVTLDTENYRAKREEALTRLANRMANRAVKTGRKVVLEPMNPYERRILHSALQANEAVTTHSEGEEPNRHVVITLKNEKNAKAAQ
jgi:spoIIIJ-associated protein